MNLLDAYRVLEVPPGTSRETAREARNLLVKVWHPDRHQGDQKVRTRAEEKLKEINEAYGLLERLGFPQQAAPASPGIVRDAAARQNQSRRAESQREQPQPASSNPSPYDWTQRQLCPDGVCIGVIGDDGICKLCGMKTTRANATGSARNDYNREDKDREHDGREHNEHDDDPEDDRQLCPDGACIGLIGPGGDCKLCGKRAS